VRILFDNNIPKRLRRHLPEHAVRTSDELKWEQIKNGDLLKAAEAAGFDVMVTGDQNIRYQQNLMERKIALVVLGSNRWPLLKPHLTEIAAAIDAATPNSYVFIEIPLPPKPEYRAR
jgi:hypothetical protein